MDRGKIMHIGLTVLLRINGEVKEGKVEVIFKEDLSIRLLDGTLIIRKWWEIRKLINTNEKE